MASISKFNSALLTVPNELTVAAANFNINFSLMKVEAPKEFHGLRDALSRIRRRDAEEGLPHITARTLGALFESVIPPIPHLTTAYGKRVSEISQHLEEASQHYLPTGLFADRAGPDGTSIWAAATSGQSAIAVHFLACMLARIWKPTEATSLWAELVERRKEQIHQAYNSSNATGASAIMAAQQIFSRDQFSSWDASARSWLQTADSVKCVQQTQLMLIINNIHMPVNANRDPYDGVLRAWTSALSAVERLVSGVPQRVQDGAILLAISSWHLYPDIQVLGDVIQDISQKDELTAGSLLTISISAPSATRDGIFWSLPLSRMRYYSPPVTVERHFALDTSRITMAEFQVVFLGAVVGRWARLCSDEERWCRLICRFEIPKPSWMHFLAGAASRVTNSSGHLRKHLLQLLKLGSRRCSGFLNDPKYITPCLFGLENFRVLVHSIRNVEERVGLLRRAAETRGVSYDDAIIRFRTPSRAPHLSIDQYEFASAVPRPRNSRKRTLERHETSSAGHQRIAFGYLRKADIGFCGSGYTCGCVDPAGPKCICAEANTVCSDRCHPGQPDPMGSVCLSPEPPLSTQCGIECPGDHICVSCFNRAIHSGIAALGEEAILITPGMYRGFDGSVFFSIALPGSDQRTTYELVLGDENLAGLFVKTNLNSGIYRTLATMDELESAVMSSSFSVYPLDKLRAGDNPGSAQQEASLNAFAFACNLYASLMGATISIEVIGNPIYKAQWATYRHLDGGLDTPRENANKALHHAKVVRMKSFACLAWFESGEFDIAPNGLGDVFALANGDSIYVASAFLSDPAVYRSKAPISRVFGNVGRPELTLMIPPSHPRLAEPDLRSWKLINHCPFDGTFQNGFASTSLHLTFTDFEMPLDVGARGLRDRQVVLLESLVSIDDRGRKVGDLDILSMFDSERLTIEICPHMNEHEAQEGSPVDGLVSLDCWDEFLDPPRSAGVFRATGNWQARLSAAAAGIQAAWKRVLVLPESPCVRCLQNYKNMDESLLLVA